MIYKLSKDVNILFFAISIGDQCVSEVLISSLEYTARDKETQGLNVMGGVKGLNVVVLLLYKN